MEKISAYILTFNSELHLKKILERILEIADEIIIVDSGSTDKTQKIANNISKVRFIYKSFKSFKEQRSFAVQQCTYDTILFLDSDEIPSNQFVRSVKKLKQQPMDAKLAYKVKRIWNVLGCNIHSIYPITSPDFPIRLYNRKYVNFNLSNLVHETPKGHHKEIILKGHIKHITFNCLEEMNQKLEIYTDLAAKDTIERNKKVNLLKVVFSPIAAFIKWYFFKKGYKDGKVGLILANYASKYTLKKYVKALKIRKAESRTI